MNTTPFWTSAFSGYGSGIYLADINNDSFVDLLTGGWWQPVRIYLNDNGNFNSTPEYTSTSTSVVEVITAGDVNNDALQNSEEIFISDGTAKLFYLSRTPLQSLNIVIVDDDTLAINEYCFDLENGWVMLAQQPQSGSEVKVETQISWDIDMGITNWDQSKGNYLFYNTTDPVGFQNEKIIPEGFVLYQNYPNPFNPTTVIGYLLPETGNVTLKVYDVLGNEVATLVNDQKPAGEYEVEFNPESSIKNPASGVYFYQLQTGSFIETKKMVYLK
jgi:hypothetical protein